MEYIIAIIVIAVLVSLVVYNIKKAERKHAEAMAEIEENNQKIMKERKARRERIESTYPTSYTPPTRTFVKREESKPTYAPSPTQSVTYHNDSVTDTLVNAMILDAVMHHHNEPVISTPRYDARVESDTPDTSTSSMSYSKSDDTPSYSSSSRDSSYSSSSSDSSYSSSSSDSSYSSSSSSDW